jgi:hypothetical protein
MEVVEAAQMEAKKRDVTKSAAVAQAVSKEACKAQPAI